MTAPTETLLDGVSGFPLVDAEMTRPSTRAWGETSLSRSSEKRCAGGAANAPFGRSGRMFSSASDSGSMAGE